ncbi:MAG: acyl-CoA dehydrogenase [Glaciecola sp.]
MDFSFSPQTQELRESLLSFMDEHVYPAEAVAKQQVEESGDRQFHAPVMEELKAEAKRRGLWNLFLPAGDADASLEDRDTSDLHGGAGLTNLEYAPLAEIMGRSIHLAPEATNCAAPDTGNMEVLAQFGSQDQKDEWLRPLLAGEIRSCFAMTEPAVASSDARNIESSIVRDGDEYVINGTKWWSSGAASDRCKVAIFMGKTDPEAETYRQQSMVVVPFDTPGVEIVRELPVFGYWDGHGGHPEVSYTNVRVPITNILKGEGEGFAIAQARLGPGRIHHAMRAIGMAERAFDLMCERVISREAFGKQLASQGVIQQWIADCRIQIEQVRLLTFKTAWLMDTVGNRGARVEISAIKVAAPAMAEFVIDKAIQAHGAGGVSEDHPLAQMWAVARTMRIFDGPDEVHRAQLAKRELGRYLS